MEKINPSDKAGVLLGKRSGFWPPIRLNVFINWLFFNLNTIKFSDINLHPTLEWFFKLKNMFFLSAKFLIDLKLSFKNVLEVETEKIASTNIRSRLQVKKILWVYQNNPQKLTWR